jgi:hypothetical protein
MKTSFAPAPTGWLRVGHVVNADRVWQSGAAVLLSSPKSGVRSVNARVAVPVTRQVQTQT